MGGDIETRFSSADDEAHHYDLYHHVRFQPSYNGESVCLECREIDALPVNPSIRDPYAA